MTDSSGANLGFAGASSFPMLTGADNPLGAITPISSSAPAFVDLDGDGDLDLVVGALDTVRVFRNEDGSNVFTELTGTDNPLAGLSGAPDLPGLRRSRG